jgi:putative transposase
MTTSARARYTGYQFRVEIIGYAVRLYFRFPLGLRMVEELLAARGIIVSHEALRQWALKFGQHFANQIRRRLPRVGDKWHLDEVALKIPGVRHLVVASRGPGWRRAQRPDATPTRQSSGQAATTPCHDHR